ncbi:reverse transcriptase [Tanacetum coccineum]
MILISCTNKGISYLVGCQSNPFYRRGTPSADVAWSAEGLRRPLMAGHVLLAASGPSQRRTGLSSGPLCFLIVLLGSGPSTLSAVKKEIDEGFKLNGSYKLMYLDHEEEWTGIVSDEDIRLSITLRPKNSTHTSTNGGLLTNPVPLETEVANLTTNVNQITQMLQEIQARLNNGEGTSQRRENGGQSDQNGGHNGGAYGRLTKVEFPKFDGEEVVSWLYRVNSFFEMDHIVENDQKIRLVSMHLFGKALNWHKYFMSKYGEVMTWEVYQTHVQKRFESVFEDLVVELKNLRQTTSVQVNQDSFEELLNKVDIKDTYAVSLFIRGLKEEITYAVRMFKPTSLSDAFCLAKLKKANNSVTRGRPTQYKLFLRMWLSKKEMEEKRARQLCFYCDQKYAPGHKCSGQLFSLEVVGEGMVMKEDDDLQLNKEGVMSTYITRLMNHP